MEHGFLYSKIRKIKGWLTRTDYEIMTSLMDAQDASNLKGSAAEIGVHHGKSFVVLASRNEVSYAIDIFDMQEYNTDKSGSGDLEAFRSNLRRFGIRDNRVIIDKRMSGDVFADDILNHVGPVRIFHIDGGHHLDAIQHDVQLAIESSAPHGVIVIDDMFRPAWPEVSQGVFTSAPLKDGDFVLFAVGFNKGYWCRREFVGQFRQALKENAFLSALVSSEYQTENSNLLVFQTYPQPEWSFGKLLRWLFELYFPNTLHRAVSLKRRLRAKITPKA